LTPDTLVRPPFAIQVRGLGPFLHQLGLDDRRDTCGGDRAACGIARKQERAFAVRLFTPELAELKGLRPIVSGQ